MEKNTKILIIVVIAVFIVTTGVLLFFSSQYLSLNLSQCLDFHEAKKRSGIRMFGEVVKTEDQPDFMVTHLSLCASFPFALFPVKVYTPKGENYFRFGEVSTVDNATSYSSTRYELERLRFLVPKGKKISVTVEELVSPESIKQVFTDIPNFVCAREEMCQDRLKFFTTYGSPQLKFLQSIKQKSNWQIMLDLLMGNTRVFSQDFGNIGSLKLFQEMVEGVYL